MKTYQPHPSCMMQECMEEQGEYFLVDDVIERIDDLEAALSKAGEMNNHLNEQLKAFVQEDARLQSHRDELLNACLMAMNACGPSENWNGKTREFLLAMEKAAGGKP